MGFCAINAARGLINGSCKVYMRLSCLNCVVVVTFSKCSLAGGEVPHTIRWSLSTSLSVCYLFKYLNCSCDISFSDA